MLSYRIKNADYKSEIPCYRIEGVCLSTDAKPTNWILNGSILIEMDTGKVFMFDEANGRWLEWGG